MRWAVGLGALLPILLATGSLLLRAAGNPELARTFFRSLRLTIAAELVFMLVLALAGFLYEYRARKQEAAQFHPAGKLIDLGGYQLHLYCTGNGGPTVVVEHGHRASYLDWYRVQPKLAEFTRVCSFDRAGHGWSDLSPEPRVPSRMAEELRRLLEAAGEKPPFILVGHSFGGLDAIMFAHMFPGDVAGLVLVDSPHPDVLRQAGWRERAWLRLMQFTMPFGLPRSRGWCDGEPQETLAIKRALTCQTKTIKTILREDEAFPAARQELRDITNLGSLPMIVIARDPETDQFGRLAAGHTQAEPGLGKLSTDSKFMVAKGSRHDIPLARPDAIVEAVKDLIKPQEPAGSQGTP